HREENPRDDERDDREREEQRLERRVGALVHPGEQRPQREGEQRRPGGELERAPEEEPGLLRSIGVAVIAERELRGLGRALRRERPLQQKGGARHHGGVKGGRTQNPNKPPPKRGGRPPKPPTPGPPAPPPLPPLLLLLDRLQRFFIANAGPFFGTGRFYIHHR